MDLKTQEQNLDKFITRYYDQPRMTGAASIMGLPHQFSMPLKQFLDEDWYKNDANSDARGDVHFFLDFCSLIEIALVAQWVPDELNPELKKELLGSLESADVRSYSTGVFRSRLPLRLYQRLTGDLNVPIQSADDKRLIPVFLRLLNVRTASQVPPISFLLKIENPESWFEVMKSERAIERFLRYNSGENERLSEFKFIAGLFQYLEFISSFYFLLQELKELQQLEAAALHYFRDMIDEKKTNVGVIFSKTEELAKYYRKRANEELLADKPMWEHYLYPSGEQRLDWDQEDYLNDFRRQLEYIQNRLLTINSIN